MKGICNLYFSIRVKITMIVIVAARHTLLGKAEMKKMYCALYYLLFTNIQTTISLPDWVKFCSELLHCCNKHDLAFQISSIFVSLFSSGLRIRLSLLCNIVSYVFSSSTTKQSLDKLAWIAASKFLFISFAIRSTWFAKQNRIQP